MSAPSRSLKSSKGRSGVRTATPFRVAAAARRSSRETREVSGARVETTRGAEVRGRRDARRYTGRRAYSVPLDQIYPRSTGRVTTRRSCRTQTTVTVTDTALASSSIAPYGESSASARRTPTDTSRPRSLGRSPPWVESVRYGRPVRRGRRENGGAPSWDTTVDLPVASVVRPCDPGSP